MGKVRSNRDFTQITIYISTQRVSLIIVTKCAPATVSVVGLHGIIESVQDNCQFRVRIGATFSLVVRASMLGLDSLN